jgi:single-stranded-DNA-specific exonuclease
MNSQRWSLAQVDEARRREFNGALGIHPITAQILVNRGVKDLAAARSYMAPGLNLLPDPFMLPDMEIAVDRVVSAIDRGERIAVYGDYDVDGVTSAALMIHFFRSLGITVDVHIPHRVAEGYGLNVDALSALKSRSVDLVITVDNGTRNASEIDIAREIGLDVVVTDHHEIEDGVPNAVAVINPKRPDSEYPDRELAGCGVAFNFVMALRKRLRERGMLPDPEPNLKDHLDLVAIGTIADIVPLQGVNRTLAKFGLEQLPTSSKPGVRALMEVSGLADVTRGVRAGHIGFRIAPRLNAAGRMGEAYPALECLIEDDEAKARELALFLERANSERQVLEERIVGEAVSQLDAQDREFKESAVVVASPRWHQGVVGIVASKLAQKTGKPCAVIACTGGVGKGSVRSAGGVNVVEALGSAADLLDRYGGHTQAAGFTIDVRRIDDFRVRFNESCVRREAVGDRTEFAVDAAVTADLIDEQLVDEIARLEPYGAGNPEPLLCTDELRVVESSIVGDSHLKLRMAARGASFGAIGFNMGDSMEMLEEYPLIAFVPQFNTWRGTTSIQLKIRAFLHK